MPNEIDGFLKLNDLLEQFAKMADPATIQAAERAGADYLVQKMRSRSAPRGRSKVHMLDTIGSMYDPSQRITYVGWVKFYGRLVESGHKTTTGYSRKKTASKTKAYAMTATAAHKRSNEKYVKAQPHMKPEFETQKTAIMNEMLAVYEGVIN